MKKSFILFIALVVTTASLLASNVITYTASDKLTETIVSYSSGLHTNAFDVSILSHTFSDGVGIITFTGEVTSIGDFAFRGCTSLQAITIPNSVTSIGLRAFYGCSSLQSIIIPNSVTSIGYYAFDGCSSLQSINVDAANTHYASIDGVLFNNAKDTLIQYPIRNARTSYIIPNSVTSIGEYAFNGCSSLQSITLPNSVSSIERRAFLDCTSLQSITIPNSVTSIGYRAFYGCTSLPIENNLRYADNYLVEAVNKTLSTYTIKIGTKWIGADAFSSCSSLQSITFPNSVTSIENYAFSDCSSLQSITFPNSVISIESYAFSDCSSLQSITLPNSVTSIGDYAFSDCSSLQSITIPNSVTSIGKHVFLGCGLSSITCYATTPPSCGGECFDGVDKSIPVYVLAGSVSAYKAANEWKYFRNYIPMGYTITLLKDDHVKNVFGAGIFDYNSEVTISATADFGYYFSQWSDGNTENPRTFILSQDTTLTAQSAKIYSGQCGDSLYWRYSKGTLTITGTGDMYDAEVAPWELFRDSITSVILPKGLTSIGYGGAFEKCKNLGSIDIPSSVTKINSYAFYNCEKLNGVTLPISLTSLGYSAFGGCRDLLDVYCLAPMPPLADASSFTNYNVYLHVPCDNLKKYQTDAVFGSFKYIECIGAEETSATDISIVAGETSATFTWPIESTAETYNLEIKKDGVVFCTLTFNATGQLTSIAFAPARGMQQSTEAIATATGYRFTVTGLDAASWYSYDFDVKNSSQQSVKNYKGNFATNGATNLEETSFSSGENRGEASKVIINGILYILRDGQYYTAQGERVEF